MTILTDQIKNTVSHQYAEDVRAGRIATGKKIKLQVESYF